METLLVLIVITLYLILGILCLMYSKASFFGKLIVGLYIAASVFLVNTIDKDVFLIYELVNSVFLIGL